MKSAADRLRSRIANADPTIEVLDIKINRRDAGVGAAGILAGLLFSLAGLERTAATRIASSRTEAWLPLEGHWSGIVVKLSSTTALPVFAALLYMSRSNGHWLVGVGAIFVLCVASIYETTAWVSVRRALAKQERDFGAPVRKPSRGERGVSAER